MAGKCVGENVTLPEHERVNIMDSGGSWKCYFRISTQKRVVKSDSKGIVSNLMANATVLHHATVLKC